MKRKGTRQALAVTLTILLGIFALSVYREAHQQSLNRALFQAIKHGDTRAAVDLLNRGADPNVPQDARPAWRLALRPLLGRTSAPRVYPMLAHVIRNESEAEYSSGQKKHEDVALIRALLKHGARLEVEEAAWTPLAAAVSANYNETAKLLLQHGARVTAGQDPWHDPFLRATEYDTGGGRDLALIAMLLDHGAMIDEVDQTGWTPLTHAVMENNHALALLLLQRGADPNAGSESPLDEASDSDVAMVNLLLDHGALIYHRKADGSLVSPLGGYVHSDAHMLKVLLARDKRLIAKLKCTPEAIFWAANSDVVKILVGYGLSPNVRDEYHRTPLLRQLYDSSGLYGAVPGLIACGADVNAEDDQGSTPLMFAAEYTDTTTVRLLLAKGAKVNHRNKEGATALKWARGGLAGPDVVALLKRAGAKE